MKHCISKRMLSRLIDNDLPAETKTQVESHLGKCEKCRAIYKSYTSAGAVLRSLEAENTAPVFIRCRNRLQRPLLYRLLSIRILFPSAAVLTVLLAFNMFLMTDTIFTNHKTIPVLSLNSSSTLMNTLLGSFVYYEKMDSATVESQFFKLSPGVTDTAEPQDPEKLEYLTYNSPLFSDNSDDIYNTSTDGYLEK